MTTEFNLSEKIDTWTIGKDAEKFILIKDIKEFIRLLKLNISDVTETELNFFQIRKIQEQINKLAGETLK